MDTPLRPLRIEQKRRYTPEEKQQLLANLELEVSHRTRQFEESLAQILENFRLHHEGQVLRVPKLVRGITMGEFADKYNGDINECLRGLQRERQGGEPSALELDIRKRKWRLLEDSAGSEQGEVVRAPKQARVVSSPSKLDSSKLSKSRSIGTPGTVRSARHLYPSFAPTSPTKSSFNRLPSPTKPSISRLPASKEFKPQLPTTPAYPRAPRKDENLMSVNGSPLANPLRHNFNPSAPNDSRNEIDDEEPRQTIRRTRSIMIRSTSTSSSQPAAHSRVASQSSLTTSERSSSHTAQSSSDSLSSVPPPFDDTPLAHPSAFMRVPTKDGLILEFDPLSTTPDELDALEGITDSAKKQAKDDMARLVQAALARWKIA